MPLPILHTAKLLFPCSSARSTLFPLGLGDISRDPSCLVFGKQLAADRRPGYSSVRRCSSQRCLSPLMVSRPPSQRPKPSFIAASIATSWSTVPSFVVRCWQLRLSARPLPEPVGVGAGIVLSSPTPAR